LFHLITHYLIIFLAFVILIVILQMKPIKKQTPPMIGDVQQKATNDEVH